MTLNQLVSKRRFLANQITYFINESDGTNIELENEIVNLTNEMEILNNQIILKSTPNSPIESPPINNVQQHTLTNVVKFDQFLIDNDCYHKFYENFDPVFAGCTTVEDYLKSPKTGWIANAFVWEKSPQKHEYWENIDNLWQK